VKDCATPALFSLMLEKEVRSTRSVVGGVAGYFFDAVVLPGSLERNLDEASAFLRGPAGNIGGIGEWTAILKILRSN
jgi:hypothetical protein